MKSIIYEINRKKDVFYCLIDGRKVGFYLTKNLSNIFSEHLNKGYLIDFEINRFTKRINRSKHYQVNHFNQISSLTPHVVLYDINDLRKDMKDVLSQSDYYLFLDFEMTMPGYQKGPFKAEIIQYGALLTDHEGNNVLERNFYVKPTKKISKRTIKFLKLDLNEFNNQALEYNKFYQDLKTIINKYNQKIVVWGKNDILALNDSYEIHNVDPITTSYDFFDLLTLHKDFFNLNQDLGLFKAYHVYFPNNELEPQKHDARADAKITKQIFFEFLDE